MAELILISVILLMMIGLTIYTNWRKKKIMKEVERQRKDMAEIKSRARWN